MNRPQPTSFKQTLSIQCSLGSMNSSTRTVKKNDFKIPANYQPLISRYRVQKTKTNPFDNTSKYSLNFFKQFFCGIENDQSLSMCDKCDRSTDMNLCVFIMHLIQEKYDWRQDLKFKSTYEFYNKKQFTIPLTDQEIQNRIISKFNVLGILLLENHRLLLMRIIKNYIKHTIYYGQQRKLCSENDLYFWFLIGSYYHVGVPKYLNLLESLPKDSVGINELFMFWTLDTVMKKLEDCTQQKIKSVAEDTFKLMQSYSSLQIKCLQSYEINLSQIIYEWVNQGMMGYMGIEFIGFFIQSIIKQGWKYIQKTIMSYFQKRISKLDRDQIVSFNPEHPQFLGTKLPQDTRKMKKQCILKTLLDIDKDDQWPGIFFCTNDCRYRL